jgi:Helix-turn-helix domain
MAGVRPRRGRDLKGRSLSFAEREDIAVSRAAGASVRVIAAQLDRSGAPCRCPSGSVTPVEDAGTSHRANLIADPALDLRDTSERQEQVNSWLLQAGLDAGLLGMERLLGEYQASREPS